MDIDKARERMRDAVGSTLADRATDDFVLEFWGEPPDGGLRDFRTAGLRLPPIVIELAGPGPDELPAGLPRDDAVRAARDWFQTTYGARIAALKPVVAAGGRVDVSWLASAIRVQAPVVEALRLFSAAPIRSLALPRVVTRELSESASVVGVPQFRTRHDVSGAGVSVAIIDGEILCSHPALPRVKRGANFCGEPWGTPHHHGTIVAGIVASNDVEFRGMAPGVTLYNYKIFGRQRASDADDFFAIKALEAAVEDGAHVVNCSWGTNGPIDGTSREARAFDRAWGFGVVIVKSAGNKGPSPQSITCPADAEGVIAVGATTRSGDGLWELSSRGPTAHELVRPHLVAPGGSAQSHITSTSPDGGMAVARSGTSNAAPHVAGLAALLLEANPGTSPDEIREMLMRNCNRLPNLTENDQGSGLVNVSRLIG